SEIILCLNLISIHIGNFGLTQIIGEHDKKPCTALLTHLPAGPTFAFRLSSVRLPRELPPPARGRQAGDCGAAGALQSIPHPVWAVGSPAAWPPSSQAPARDYVFFRHHRYILRQPGSGAKPGAKPRCALQEVGPRFTLKLRSLQTGPLGAGGGYEWLHKRHEMDQSRRRFFL
uniref:Brix domain-containing protein n=1 Tax=Macrostomum lignano TaxID=282301 RepID=A0A1I8H8X9_9PLAT